MKNSADGFWFSYISYFFLLLPKINLLFLGLYVTLEVKLPQLLSKLDINWNRDEIVDTPIWGDENETLGNLFSARKTAVSASIHKPDTLCKY